MRISQKQVLWAWMGAAGLSLGAVPTHAAVLLDFTASTAGVNVQPSDVGWTVSTNDPPAMTNNGTYLLQDKTAVSG